MNLDDAQRRKVSEWIEQGLKLSEIQTKLGSELGLKLTYMDVRFLIDDLKLKPKDAEPPKAPATVGTAPAKSPATPGGPAQPLEPLADEGGLPMGGGNVSV